MVFFAALLPCLMAAPNISATFPGSKGGTLLALKPERLLETVAGHKEAAGEMVPGPGKRQNVGVFRIGIQRVTLWFYGKIIGKP